MAFVACGKKAETAQDTAPATEEVVDSAAMAPYDSATMAADSAAAH